MLLDDPFTHKFLRSRVFTLFSNEITSTYNAGLTNLLKNQFSLSLVVRGRIASVLGYGLGQCWATDWVNVGLSTFSYVFLQGATTASYAKL
jgi:hypothetical protein